MQHRVYPDSLIVGGVVVVVVVVVVDVDVYDMRCQETRQPSQAPSPSAIFRTKTPLQLQSKPKSRLQTATKQH